MSDTIDNLKRDVSKDPAELEREADIARDALEATLCELEQRFSPSQLLDRFAGVVKQNGGEFGANLLAQVRNNPVPTIMAGIGVAWLMASSKRPPAALFRENIETDRSTSAMDSVRGTAESVRETVYGAAASARERAHGAADLAKDAASATTAAASRAADAARRTGDSIRRASATGAHSVAECYSYLSREQPLMLGAIAIVAGAAIGALLPGTRTEDEWVGETSDAAKSRLKAEAKQQLGDLQEAATEVADAARETFAGGMVGGEANSEQTEMHPASG
jgi:uncharacterized protein DUF3618